jgi:hypothetical protein
MWRASCAASRTAFSDWIIALPNRLDEITSVIGNIEAEVHNLCASAEQHRENREKFESFSQRVEKIEADMKPLGKTVATMADRLRATL